LAHPVILPTQETEIRRIKVRSQPRQTVCETLSLKTPSHTKKAGGMAQGVGPEFKPQYHTKKQKTKNKKTKPKTGDWRECYLTNELSYE
jgi:hypothetical protein